MKKLAMSILTASAVLLASQNASAACSGLGGIGLLFGVQGAIAASHLVAFTVPAIAQAARKDDINYWPGFGYVSAGSSIAGFTTLAVTQIKCDQGILFGPPLAALGGGIIAGIIWGFTTDGEPKGGDFDYYNYSVTSLDVAPTEDRRGAVLTVGGCFRAWATLW